ncbi:gliding motility-associated C-terminal domain-containing protein [Hymenobacter sp. BT730]|uniref:gliding motility-associated C-terminal domain-containing protein n=1 Tax=Hymenobacter sp. BT730 TaxID=3063332 RepID=UPI0026DFAB08|nr:gliding motility-associated C-terminal domain-containing protein [Hymenobacter sp. BT730]
MTLLLPTGWRTSRLLFFILLLLAALLSFKAQATHIRAGDIQAKSDTTANRDPRRVFFKMVLYTDPTSGADTDDTETIFFGDGTNSGINAIVRSSRTFLGNNIYRNVYYFEHTYNAPKSYVVSFVGELRQGGIANMSNSKDLSFYISTRITIDPVLGVNRSPVLNAPPIDLATTNQVFLHNPAASDEDNDSLAYRLAPSQYVVGDVAGGQSTGNLPRPVVVPNYAYPNEQSVSPNGKQVAYPAGNPPPTIGAPATFTIDALTGQLVWNSPSVAGLYNVAIIVEEWRRDAGGRRLIGEVIRDMQIIVNPTNNQRPVLQIPRDICVVAGDSVRGSIRATDPDGNDIDLTAFGGVFSRLPVSTPAEKRNFRALFEQTRRASPATGRFRWLTTCADVARLPYQVLFRAVDVPTDGETPLIDEQVWRITVVGPPPQNLKASGQGAAINLTWDKYGCQNATQILIFRREGPANFQPDTCNPGIPASAGYVQVGSVSDDLTTFLDNNNGRGLERGKTYCYRIYAEYPLPAGGKSLVSKEVCVELVGRPILLTNVTVERTSKTSGSIKVIWTKPNITKVGFAPPVGYNLYRAEGINPASTTFTRVQSFTNINDTVYVDNGLNTTDKAFTYRIEFTHKSGTTAQDSIVHERPAPASSVRLETAATPARDGIVLNWNYSVPWDNTVRPTRIYRREPCATGYTLLTTVPGVSATGTYTDNSTGAFKAGQLYCYYVETDGEYKSPLIGPLLNKSQESCILTPPVLTLQPINCDSLAALPFFPNGSKPYANRLSWTIDATSGCNAGISYYRIYFSPTQSSNPADFRLIDSTETTSYVHANLETSAGCYYVVAVARELSLVSAPSNIACHDACLFFLLPNIFTPNGDGKNDTFRPKLASPIRRTKFTAFNRWGVKVYESDQNPLIEWNGTNKTVTEGNNSPSSRVVDGLYFYQAEVEFADFANTKKTYKGWVQITR